jgi:membrane protein implicated in regulation of membrane protease activity
MLFALALVTLAAVLLAAELVVNGMFFAPAAVGSLAGAVVSFLGAPVTVTVAIALGTTALAFAALRPLAARLNDSVDDTGIGARRLENARAVCESDVGATGGLVRVERELWQAESVDGSIISSGTEVTILHVRGTRLVVTADPPDRPAPSTPTP